jgi:hypothetical protein
MIVISKHRRAQKNLSAYADGELTLKEKQALEAHLETCEQCRLDLDGLHATVNALRSLPEVEPRRAFALTPEMLAPTRTARRPGSAPALTYGTRLAAAGLAAALVIVFTIDVSGGGQGQDESGRPVGFANGQSAERDVNALEDSADGGPPATTIPEPIGTLAPLNQPEPGAAGGGVGGASDETPATDGGYTTDDASGGEETVSSGEEAADDSTADAADAENGGSSGDAAIDEGGDDAGSADQPASVAGDDGGFDILLALEIALAAAFAVALAGAVWMTIAARQRETRP